MGCRCKKEFTGEEIWDGKDDGCSCTVREMGAATLWCCGVIEGGGEEMQVRMITSNQSD